MIIAKPVINRRFWILQKDNQKIGNVRAHQGGYQVLINNTVQQFKSIGMVKKITDIQFEPEVNTLVKKTTSEVHGYLTASKAYNPMWDIALRLPLFTKTKKSKSWFAAGWYRVKQNNMHRIVQDPKLITLKRYEYIGPYAAKEEVE